MNKVLAEGHENYVRGFQSNHQSAFQPIRSIKPGEIKNFKNPYIAEGSMNQHIAMFQQNQHNFSKVGSIPPLNTFVQSNMMNSWAKEIKRDTVKITKIESRSDQKLNPDHIKRNPLK